MPKKQERRNGHAFHPIMSKGGAHGKSKKAQRKAAKHEVNRKVHEWLGRSFLRFFVRVADFSATASREISQFAILGKINCLWIIRLAAPLVRA